MEILLALIQQLNAAVFTLIAILLVTFWIVFRVGKYTEKFSEGEEQRKEIKTDIREIRKDISKIGAITELLYESKVRTMQTHSPVSLSPQGEEAARSINAEEKVARHWDEIKKRLQIKNPQNPYDIQTVSMDVARECFDKLLSPEERDEIKTYAFRAGLNLLEIYPVLGVFIRNAYLKEKGFSLQDVDKHAPVDTH